MSAFNQITQKIKAWPDARQQIAEWQQAGETVVFTNGCFDILHYGHVHYLSGARDLGDRLVVGMNSAESIKRLKGPTRPIHDRLSRQHIMAGLSFVDLVVEFEQDTPLELIKTLLPNILVKGGDWKPSEIVGSDIVMENGGEVLTLPYVEGYSTTALERKMQGKF